MSQKDLQFQGVLGIKMLVGGQVAGVPWSIGDNLRETPLSVCLRLSMCSLTIGAAFVLSAWGSFLC